ncbi:hypothetical protein XELAEV_18029679mg [Xenopus laevis]|uniref:Uncharacterized protein n=1 Tax=Xenopus laevis TaxID=8355 RepID=A0A974CSD6_XENLA|nr:hypothetical protein XELAEV_18029679mg [Xenopus laevis]
MARCLCRTCEILKELLYPKSGLQGGQTVALHLFLHYSSRVAESYSSATAGRPQVTPHCCGLVFGLFLYRRKQKSWGGGKGTCIERQKEEEKRDKH